MQSNLFETGQQSIGPSPTSRQKVKKLFEISVYSFLENVFF